jgi:hypothetical protein
MEKKKKNNHNHSASFILDFLFYVLERKKNVKSWTRTSRVAQAVEHLPYKCKALGNTQYHQKEKKVEPMLQTWYKPEVNETFKRLFYYHELSIKQKDFKTKNQSYFQ